MAIRSGGGALAAAIREALGVDFLHLLDRIDSEHAVARGRSDAFDQARVRVPANRRTCAIRAATDRTESLVIKLHISSKCALCVTPYFVILEAHNTEPKAQFMGTPEKPAADIEDSLRKWGEQWEFREKASAALPGLSADPIRSFVTNEWIAHNMRGTPLTSGERFGLLLSLVNTRQIPFAKALAMASDSHLMEKAPDTPKAKVAESLIEELKGYLQRVVDSEGDKASSVLRELEGKLVGTIVGVPEFREGRISWRHFAADTPDALRFSVALLCSSDAAANLCRCKYQQCGRFFFAQRVHQAGLVMRNYCTSEHRDEHHRIRTAERVRKSRAEAKKRKSKDTRRHK